MKSSFGGIPEAVLHPRSCKAIVVPIVGNTFTWRRRTVEKCKYILLEVGTHCEVQKWTVAAFILIDVLSHGTCIQIDHCICHDCTVSWQLPEEWYAWGLHSRFFPYFIRQSRHNRVFAVTSRVKGKPASLSRTTSHKLWHGRVGALQRLGKPLTLKGATQKPMLGFLVYHVAWCRRKKLKLMHCLHAFLLPPP